MSELTIMETKQVKLLGAIASPFVIRVRIALNIKSIKYQFIQENILNKSELLLKSNPIHKTVPVLLHDEQPICESLIIVQYVDDVWTSGPPILPTDPHDRALARFWAAYIDDKFYSELRSLRNARGEEEIKAGIEKMMDVMLSLEEAFVKCSKGNPFFGGENIGYVDIALGCGLTWFKVLEKMNNLKLLDETKMSNLVAWSDKFCQDPSVKDVMPDADHLVHIYKLFIAKDQVTAN